MALAVGTGRADFAPEFELSGLDGSNGIVINGVSAEDESGTSVSFAGDINDDGIDDLIIGAPYATTGALYSGATYVVYGASQGLPQPLDLSTIDGSNGVAIHGVAAYDFSGFSVSGIGDMNGDGIDDLAIGAPVATPGDTEEAGASYVIFGTGDGFSSPLDLESLDGSNGFVIKGIGVYSNSGTSVSAAGDLNGDGIDDLAIGAPYDFGGAGAAYVVFGSNSGFGPSLELLALDGTNGFRIDGEVAGDSLGNSVSGVGDINGDGVDDLFVGAPLAGPSGANPGAAYVVYGRSEPNDWPAALNVASLDGDNGFAIIGVSLGDSAGTAVSRAGDFNSDGFADLAIGAPGADPNEKNDAGVAYVVFGGNSPTNYFHLSNLDGNNGFAIFGENAGDEVGTSVNSAGDINGDGIADLSIGAPFADPSGADSGASYVLFGGNQALEATLSLSGLDGNNGFQINGIKAGDKTGTCISAAGDINADGRADLILGAPVADPNGVSSGASYVIFDFTSGAADTIFSDGFEE